MSKQDIWQWLGPLARGWGAEEKLKAQAAVLVWAATGLAPLARALYVDRGVLHLAVGSHVVASELNLLKGEVLARLEEIAPGCSVADLRFHVQGGEPPLRPVEVPPPSKADLREARAELPPGLPPRLRSRLAKALAWAKARDRAIRAAGGWECQGCGLVLVREREACPTCGIERFGIHR